MARLALQLAFFVSATRLLTPKLYDFLRIEPTPCLDMIPFLPAVILGMGSLWRVRCFARSWTVIACIVLVWAGLVFGDETQSLRGLLIAACLTIILPVSALIVENRCWWLCAKTFIFGCVFMLTVAIWFEYRAHGDTLYASALRLGFLASEDGSMRLSSPDKVGGPLATAAILAFLLFLMRGMKSNQPRNAAMPASGFSIGWTIVLSLGCILTASRGAFVAWFAGMGWLLIWAVRSQEPNKLRDLIALSGMSLSVMLFVAIATGFGPWYKLQVRFTETDQVLTLSGRTEIWENALEAWRSSPRYTFVGPGTGRADELLGRFDRDAAADDYGTLTRNIHSAFLEWGLSYGILGMVVGGCLLVSMALKARELDRRDRIVGRQALLLSVCLFANTGIIHRWPGWLATGSLILAMLSEAPRPVRKAPPPHFRYSKLPTGYAPRNHVDSPVPAAETAAKETPKGPGL